MSKDYVLNWKRQPKDGRDWLFSPALTLALPSWVDQRAKSPWGGCPGIYDQLAIGSCTANAGVSSFRQLYLKERNSVVDLSRLDQYYSERVIEGTPTEDSGATIRDIMKAAATYGICREDLWPYGDGSTFAGPPSAEATLNAKLHRLGSYLACVDLSSMLQSLAIGFPVCFGLDVYESFMSGSTAATGVIPMPDTKKERLLGGHALKAVGYRMSSKVVIFANSWSQGWGDKGYGYIPFAYLASSMAADFWTPRLF